MWSDNIKLWIVLTIFHTTKSQYVEYYGNPGGIMFPGPIESSNNQKIKYNSQLSTCTNCHSPVTNLAIAKELEAIETVEDFFNFINSKPGEGRELLLSKRFGDENERSNVINAKPGKCRVDMKIVPFRNENTPSSISYWPYCTRVERCDGCCSTELWSCQPINKTMLNFKVFKYEMNENGKVDFRGEEIIPLEKHISCQCLCKVKAHHCTKKQKYIEKDCRCECANTDEIEKCNTNRLTTIWNPETCQCNCRNIIDCNTGYYYDIQKCSCTKDLRYHDIFYTSQRTENQNNPSFRISTVTLPSASDPRRKHKDED